jgi:hypothetical protein
VREAVSRDGAVRRCFAGWTAQKNPLEEGWFFEGMRFIKMSITGTLVKVAVAAPFVVVFGFFGD